MVMDERFYVTLSWSLNCVLGFNRLIAVALSPLKITWHYVSELLDDYAHLGQGKVDISLKWFISRCTFALFVSRAIAKASPTLFATQHTMQTNRLLSLSPLKEQNGSTLC